MKVLQINQGDLSGGGNIAAYRLHQQLRKQLIESYLLVDIAKLDDSATYCIQRRRFVEDLAGRFSSKLGLNYLHILGTNQISSTEIYQKVDLLNFHNLHGGYFNYLAIAKLTHAKPAVYTLHDMWSFTGHCAYSFDCDRWKHGCGHCPYPDTYPEITLDSTALEWKLKRWIYNRSNLTIVTPSQWLANLARQSLLQQFPVHHIPNGLDVTAYQPLDPDLCRSALGISSDQRVLLFMAQSLKDSRKGCDLLLAALQQLPTSLKGNLVLVTVGNGGDSLTKAVDIPTLSLGYVAGDRLKSLVYSAADVFVFPTRADNLPVVIQESMACGTPVVSFDVGGVSEMVRPGITGLLAHPEDSTDLATKIVEILEDQLLRCRLKQNCRDVAVNEYSIELQCDRYISLYKEVLTSLKAS